jgi:hypothetical protein
MTVGRRRPIRQPAPALRAFTNGAVVALGSSQRASFAPPAQSGSHQKLAERRDLSLLSRELEVVSLRSATL